MFKHFRFIKKFRFGLAPALALITALSAQADISLESVIPDPNFRKFLRESVYGQNTSAFNTAQNNGTWTPSAEYGSNPLDKDEWQEQEFALIKVINLNGKSAKVASLEGIQMFPNLNVLKCANHELEEVDLTGLFRLTEVDLSKNHIYRINMESYNYLSGPKKFNISSNQLSKMEMLRFCDQYPSCSADSRTLPEVILYDPNSYMEYNELSNMAVFALVYDNAYAKFADGTDCCYMAAVDLDITEFAGDPNLAKYLKKQAYYDNQTAIDSWDFSGHFAPIPWNDSGKFSLYAGMTPDSDNCFDKDTWHMIDVFMVRKLLMQAWNESNASDQALLVTDMSNIQNFFWLEFLQFDGHKVSTLDVSDMVHLGVLRCNDQTSDTKLTRLNVTGCESLYQLYCDNNALTTLDVTTLGNLNMLRCNNNPIGDNGLDVSQNAVLKWLDCYNCNLPSIDVTKNPKLEVLYCYETRDNEVDGPESTRRGRIVDLDLSQNPELVQLRCSNNPLRDLDLSHNPKLEILYCNSIKLDEGKLQKNLPLLPELRRLSCYNDTLDVLDVSHNTKLWELICYKNELKRLDLSKNEALTYLSCGENQSHDGYPVDERNVPLPYGGNHITTLDVSKNVNLKTLHCAQMWLTELDLRGLTLLEDLNYAEQERTIRAEKGLLVKLVNGQPESKNIYYLRMDDNRDDNGLLLTDRIRPTDWDEIVNFDLSLVDMTSWTSGVLFEGTRKAGASAPRRVVATVDDLNAGQVYGKILVLTDVTENDNTATGTVTYKYDVRKEADAPATDEKTHFTLNWYTEPGIVTAVDDLGVAREVACVDYYNALGMRSGTPWPGVNVVVTHFEDGTQHTTKRLF